MPIKNLRKPVPEPDSKVAQPKKARKGNTERGTVPVKK